MTLKLKDGKQYEITQAIADGLNAHIENQDAERVVVAQKDRVSFIVDLDQIESIR